MDYEKKYKEALGKARQLCAYPTTKPFISDLQDLFPELAESEGEKVRKALIDFFGKGAKYGGQTNGVYDKDILAWLEKQGSLKDIIDRAKDSWYNEGKIAGMAEGLTDDEKYQQGWHDALEKQGELAKGEDYGIDGLWHAQRILEKTLGKVEGYQSDDGILEHKCAITAVKELYEQKPTNWSEEDETGLTNTIIMLKEGASLHFNKKDITKAVDWLQSLKGRVKPQWKPSDVQIECLSDAIEHYNSLGYPASKLKELLNDLNKLKEGKV